MDLPAVIDIAIGLVLLYLLLSTLSSIVVEMIATWRWWRPRLLYETIGRLITGVGHCPAPQVPWLPGFGRTMQSRLQHLPKWLRPSGGPASWFLTSADILDPKEIVRQVRQPSNPVCEFVSQELGAHVPVGRVASARKLARWLNRLITEESLYKMLGGSGATPDLEPLELSTETRALLGEVQQAGPGRNADEVRRLNRLLLEDANPGSIARQRRLTGEMLSAFWNHPLARNLSPEGRLPSYMEPTTFAAIVIDLAVPGAAEGTAPGTAEGIERNLDLAVRSGHAGLAPLRAHLLAIQRLREVQGTSKSPPEPPLAALRTGVARWYNEAMERLTCQYKRKASKALFWTGLALAALLNADTLRTIHVLGKDDALRTASAAYAATFVTPATNAPSPTPVPPASTTPASSNAVPTPATAQVAASTTAGGSNNPTGFVQTNELAIAELRGLLVKSMKDLQGLQRLGFPLGWSGLPGDDEAGTLDFAPYGDTGGWAYLLKLFGLIATAFAVALGAPFWYDLLGKLVSLRAAVKPAAEAAAGAPPTDKAASSETTASQSVPVQAAAPPAKPPEPAECLPDLRAVESGFSPRRAYWCAEAATLAYAAQESVRNAVANWGFDEPRMFERAEAAQAFLAVAADKSVALLAFRGTEKKLEDWKTDAAFEPKPSPVGIGRTHHGFTEALALVYDEVKVELSKCMGPKTLLYITGHSLGGALATLMAARLAADRSSGVHCVHTFGSPRVGDSEFTRAYHLTLGQCTYRIVNGEDLVTRVPPRVVPGKDWRYDHVGKVVYFDADGRMQLNVSFWDRFVNTAINAVADFRKTSTAALADHSMEDYVRLLRAAASKPA